MVGLSGASEKQQRGKQSAQGGRHVDGVTEDVKRGKQIMEAF